MDYFMKMPRNRKEFALFIIIVSLLSVNLIAPLITCFETGFRLEIWQDTLKVVPFIWICVVILVLITYKPADWMTAHMIEPDDSFHAQMIVNTLCTVFLMSIFLTVIGTWIGTRQITMEPVYRFFYKWPRNFAISFAVEICIAQPIARAAILRLHKRIDRKTRKEP